MNPSSLHGQADSVVDNQGSPALIPSSTVWSSTTLGCHWRICGKLGERKGHPLTWPLLFCPAGDHPLTGAHTVTLDDEGLEGHLQTRLATSCQNCPTTDEANGHNLPTPPMCMNRLWPCPGKTASCETEQRKGAINLEPRASDYSRGSTSICVLSVSVCLCEIFLGIHSFISSLGSVLDSADCGSWWMLPAQISQSSGEDSLAPHDCTTQTA